MIELRYLDEIEDKINKRIDITIKASKSIIENSNEDDFYTNAIMERFYQEQLEELRILLLNDVRGDFKK